MPNHANSEGKRLGPKKAYKVLFSALFIALAFFWLEVAWAGPRLLTASYPVWLFTRYLTQGRDFFNVELLTNPATGCPHEFAPQARDLERLSQARILIKNGLGLEAYLDRALKVASKDLVVIDASVGAPTLPLTWGRLDLGDQKASSDQNPLAPNPHIFSSPKLAALMANNIAQGLAKADPEGSVYYQERQIAFQADMDYLNHFVQSFKESRSGYRIIVSHGFMDYLAQDLGLVVLADIEPIPETPPSAARLEALAKMVRSGGISAILVEPESDLDLARTLAAEGRSRAAVVDPVTAGPQEPEIDYYQRVIRANLIMLTELFPANQSPPNPSPSGN
ncbi:MAG: zinc ABC transporter substrate-binding protein [Deltaproteobacteria bacterium]|jgi:zinc/manganese transport system substrate-binding protein/zinc transport system substrate-binding protein|nr:zinc ABC transporter substrate-binding protein [Deltaproteobacteria bacterium]